MKKIEDVQLGKRIRDIRNSLGWDQKKFSEQINSTVSALSNWENGRNKPKDNTLKKIAELGGILEEHLLYASLEEYTHAFIKNYYINNENFTSSLKAELSDDVIYQVLRNPTYHGMYAAGEFDLLNSSIQSEITRTLNRFINHHGFSNDGVINFSLSGINDIKNELKLYLEKGIDQELYKEIDAAFSNTYTQIHSLRNKYK